MLCPLSHQGSPSYQCNSNFTDLPSHSRIHLKHSHLMSVQIVWYRYQCILYQKIWHSSCIYSCITLAEFLGLKVNSFTSYIRAVALYIKFILIFWKVMCLYQYVWFLPGQNYLSFLTKKYLSVVLSIWHMVLLVAVIGDLSMSYQYAIISKVVWRFRT